MMLTMKRRCKARKGGSHTIRSFDSADTTTSSITIDLDQHKDLQTSTSASRGHASDDDCKRRRKENRKQRKREKRKAKEEAREKRHASTGDGPGTNSTASVEQEEQDAPRNDGSWLSTSLTSPSPLSSTDTDDSELSGQHATVSTSASWSVFESSSTERSLEGRLHKSEPSSVKKGGRLDFLSNVHVPASISNIGEAKRVDVRRVHLLYNPWSGNKKGEKKMRKARRLLERQGKEVTVTKLLHKGHAEELCESMDLTGIDVLCSVGGDGTFHECVNGIMKRINKSGKAAGADNPDNEESGDGDEHGPAADRIPPLAFIAAGTGNSFVHELGCARMRDAVRHICRGIEVGIDLSRLTYGEDECYSFNSIHWGIGSRVVDTAEKFRWMGNSVRYIMAALVELMKGNDSRVRMTITDEDDNEIVWDEEYALGIANSIITAGKGMKMAPTAKIDDGLIDLLLFTSKSPKDLLAVLRRFYNGTHTDLPHVRYIKAKKFTVTPYKYVTEESESGAEEGKQKKKGAMKQSTPRDADEDAATDVEAKDTEWSDDEMIEVMKEMVDIDGELKGFAPFTCEVLPRAIQVIL